MAKVVIPALFLMLEEMSFNITMMFAVGFSYMAFTMFRDFPSLPSLLSFYHDRVLHVVGCFFCINGDEHVFFFICPVNTVCYIDRFSYIVPSCIPPTWYGI